ncbi:MAG: hypothetical protein CL920_16575 [Deltaproteobacteria bacterium]|nr:hypothetical protein [Deltaproteobacteria bacterium]MBU50295.1 hypothetical protein [Deltaproteobacteria bacterium]
MDFMGIRVEAYDPDRSIVAIDVDERLFQPTGIVNGGIYVLLAETAASIAANLYLDPRTHVGFGMEINANHLRPASSGTLFAIATPIHRGRTTHVYNIDVVDDEDRKICISRCTIAIREIDNKQAKSK